MTVIVALTLFAILGLGLTTWYIRSLFRGPNYSELPGYYPFKNKAAERHYREYYNERARQWPTPSESRYIETRFGKTFVRICGKENAPPLVLLPSGFASSLIWLPNIEGLAPHFRIYAVDNIYDVGMSVNTRPVQDADDLTDWLDELFTGLEIGTISI